MSYVKCFKLQDVNLQGLWSVCEQPAMLIADKIVLCIIQICIEINRKNNLFLEDKTNKPYFQKRDFKLSANLWDFLVLYLSLLF